MLDFEKVVGGGDVAATAAGIKTWLNLIETQWGIRPVIYTSKLFWDQLNNPIGFQDYPLWLANYNLGLPALPGNWPKWSMWQYTESGSISGIGASVDLNKYNINASLKIA